MRIIDADELPVTCNVAIVNGKLELNGWIAAKRIEEAPIVKAIPIEWLKKYELAKGQEVRLQDAINEWEKENENRVE